MAVCGTGTGVGKTWVTAAVLAMLRAEGVTVSARKPVQSFEPGAGATDAEVLGRATGEAPTEVCPRHRWYERALAPPMAAEVLGRPAFTVADLAGEVAWPAGAELGMVETAGGPRSPIAADGDSADLAVAVGADVVVLVASSGLGTINAVRLATTALSLLPVVVVLNGYDDGEAVHQRNRDWLSGRDGLEVLTSPVALAPRLSR